MTTHFVSASCRGERCNICDAPATHKVGEEIFEDDPHPPRHSLTAYVCCQHFRMIMGKNRFVDRICPAETDDTTKVILSLRHEAKLVLHHDDSSCTARLENGFCPKCNLRPDMQSTCIYYYCPACDLPLVGNVCPNCRNTYKHL